MNMTVNEEHSRPTQCEIIIRHLEDYGSITPVEGLKEYGIMRLASRVSELNKRGAHIIAEMVTGKNRYSEKVHYARYSFATKKEN